MSLLPYLLDYELAPRSRGIRDQLLVLDLAPEDFLLTDIFDRPRKYVRQWRNLSSLARDVGSTIKADKDKFQINLDVQHFAPEEVSVKVSDNYVVIEGKHEEKQDEHGYVTRQFKRRYALPEECNAEAVESKLSSDGVLTITAPKLALEKGERVVPIAQTGPVRRKLQDRDTVEQEEQNGEPEQETKSPQKKRKR
ncbi:alpha-crystallin A chain-like [Bicyclus anynana]|uniref:Alpha-crystallin A chain-like n=1 Tax=Bicyclus anynana TaxID=110368 RepID=A0A6J1NLJ1_BICAN|nr:alpha-crystallin A chain-like [Bicyclus anynana]